MTTADSDPPSSHAHSADDTHAAASADQSCATNHVETTVPIAPKSLALMTLATLAIMYMAREMRDVFIPIALSILVFHSLAPFVTRLVKWRIPRTLAALVVMSAMVGAVGSTAYSLSDEAAAVVLQMPDAAKRLRAVIRGLRDQPGVSLADQMRKAASELESTAKEAVGGSSAPRGVVRVQIEEPVIRSSDVLMGGFRNVTVLVGSTVLVLVFTLFLLISADRLKRIVVEVVGPTLSRKKVTVQILDEIARQMQSFLLVQIAASILVAVLTTLVLWWLGLQNAAVWGAAAGVLNTLPYFGPLLTTIGLAGVALVQFGTFSMTAWVAGAALLITSIEGYFLTPLMHGRATQMNQVAVFVGILFWSWMWGPIGLLLAVPMTMMIKVFCDHVEDLQPIGRLMGE